MATDDLEARESARLFRGNLSPRAQATQGQVAPAGSSGSVKLGGGSWKCARCKKTVFANERSVAAGQDWHTACLKCPVCSKRLDATTLTEHDGEVYCTPCYGRKYGPHGVGFAGGGSFMHADGHAAGSKPVEADAKCYTSAVNTTVVPKPSQAASLSAGTQAAGPANFCGQCGHACGGARFCSKCGHKLQ